MTTDRATKKAIRSRQAVTGESYRDARAALRTPLSIIAVYAYNGSRRHVHAAAWRPDGDNQSSERFPYWRALCGVKGRDSYGLGGLEGIPARKIDGERLVAGKSGPEVEFDPAVLRPDESACPGCVAAWRESYGPQVAATKQCKTCGVTKPLNHFPRHGSASDGVTSTCSACKRERKAALAKAETDLRDRAREDADAAHRARWQAAIDGYQRDAQSATFRCQNGHALDAIVKGGRFHIEITWTCPCGTTPFAESASKLISAWEVLSREDAGSPFTVTV